ncbi:polyamine oxidase-like [Acanthaster planci]|uniref:Polyamine oxidase-like n=1 Tax=Acanthaster planci TaxID=133434 RepID=A0A8B7XY82_ACAPL|nr:polyamine oxidase-like [Acanthaster planci]
MPIMQVLGLLLGATLLGKHGLVTSQGIWQQMGAGYQGGGHQPNPNPPQRQAPAPPQTPRQGPGYYPAQPPVYGPGSGPAAQPPISGPGQGPAQPPVYRPGQGVPPQGPGQGPAPLPPPTNSRVKFLILGAGAAGLQAADTLISKGETDFLVLEGAETYGGRIRDIPFAGVRVEVGADAPRPKSEAFDSAVRGLGGRLRLYKPNWQSLNIVSEEGITNLTKVALQTHAWPRVAYTVIEGLNLAEELIESHDSDMSVRAAFQSLGWFPTSPLDKTLEWLHFDYQMGDVPRMASLKAHRFDAPELIVQRGPNANPHLQVTDQRGFKSYFDATMRLMKDPMHRNKILFNKEVVEVNYGSPNHITVTCRDGSSYQADWAISTFSLGVLQRQIVKFTPEFPGWKTRELNRFTMGAHTKVLMEFPNTFWGSREFVLRVSERRGHFPLFVDLGKRIPELRRSDRHVLMAEITGDEARRIDAQSPQQTSNEIMRALRRMYKFNIPDPIAIHVSGWNSNPLTMGSHSLFSPTLNSNCFAKVQARLGRLLFAGEYTSLNFGGHIQGALQSGEREANKAYLCSTGGTCPEWFEGMQCACSGTPPPALSGTSRPNTEAQKLNLTFCLVIISVLSRLLKIL